MSRDSLNSVPQVGAVPWRRTAAGIEVLLVTSSSDPSRWIVPKGHIEPHLGERASAAQEAFEEAGCRGSVGESPLGTWRYSKRGFEFVVDVFPMEVTEILETWHEESVRKRRWFPLDRAVERIDANELKAMLRLLPGMVSPSGTQ